MRPIAVALLLVAFGWGISASEHPVASGQPSASVGAPDGLGRPNIVFILTDDQRWDSLAPVKKPNGKSVRPMPKVDDLLAKKGITLTNYFLSNSLCCPSRTSILRGLYSHGTKIYNNKGQWGGFDGFVRYRNDKSNIATWLHDAGYRTGLVGKFLNGYGSDDAKFVPRGWDVWNATTSDSYYGVTESVNGVETPFSPDLYQTDVIGQQAVDFIGSTPADQPLFLYWSPHAPHEPATPAPKDEGSFSWLRDYRPPSFNESDVSDKPRSMRKRPLDARGVEKIDRFRELQYESLRDVDRWVGAIVDELEALGRLDHTLIVFSSDNGMMYGEHRIDRQKNVAYEESIRSPFIARWDGVIARGTSDDHLAVNIDLAATFADAAGVDPDYELDGTSLLPILQGSLTAKWRRTFLIEHGGGARIAPPFCAARTEDGLVYVWYFAERDEELYDLDGAISGHPADPYELENRAGRAPYEDVVAELHAWVVENCVPRPPVSG